MARAPHEQGLGSKLKAAYLDSLLGINEEQDGGAKALVPVLLPVALEQTYGSWFVGISGFVAQRTARTVGVVHERLAPQYTGLASGAYSWPNDAAIAVSIAVVGETAATVNGVEDAASARYGTTATVAGIWPFSDRLRARMALFAQPPVDGLGKNQPGSNGLTLALLWTLL